MARTRVRDPSFASLRVCPCTPRPRDMVLAVRDVRGPWRDNVQRDTTSDGMLALGHSRSGFTRALVAQQAEQPPCTRQAARSNRHRGHQKCRVPGVHGFLLVSTQWISVWRSWQRAWFGVTRPQVRDLPPRPVAATCLGVAGSPMAGPWAMNPLVPARVRPGRPKRIRAFRPSVSHTRPLKGGRP